MKRIFITLCILIAALSFTNCTKESASCDGLSPLPIKLDTIKIESSMKGWELYSWPSEVEGCRKWNYALLPGTNRLKSYNEVTNDAVLKVTGENQLKLLLSKFPANQTILWVGDKWLSDVWGQSNINYGNLKLPSSLVTNEIKQHCVEKGLQLTIAQ